jgi:hypothetical protein
VQTVGAALDEERWLAAVTATAFNARRSVGSPRGISRQRRFEALAAP